MTLPRSTGRLFAAGALRRLLAAGALLALGCKSGELPVRTIQVGGHPLQVEVVSTPETRAKGLMHRDDLPADRGMLFVYPQEQPLGFWMKNTRVPLSIAFADRHGTIVRIADMTPFSLDRVPSLYPAMYAVEVNQGWFRERGVEKGDKITGLPTDLTVE